MSKQMLRRSFSFFQIKVFEAQIALDKIFNRKTVSRKEQKLIPMSNYRKKDDCPVDENCLIKNVIHKCSVFPTTTTQLRAYLGLAERE